ncbi:MAG: RsmE family RNA methyltransferase [Clostridia bacterium]
MRRFFVESSKREGNLVTIDGDEFFHMTTVLRLNEKNSIEVCFNDGIVWQGIIEKIEKRYAIVNLLSSFKSEAEAKTEVTVFQALAKGDKMDLITQKLTELGVFELIPFESQFTVVKANNGKENRLDKIAIQSSKQCGRAISMIANEPIIFDKVCEMLGSFDLVIFANETEEEIPLSKVLQENKDAKKIAIIVGSEGGFSEDEIKKVVENKGISVTLGKRILRCETASIVLSAIVMFAYSELGG